ncbi:winged helix-turn-helix domain-containing protein [Candidatus Solirubrobacter pratensis]|uniref:winged helix-turn-helix domain-containing protein n=1 Tax=Candidatus Solirubrobacter pratensis TaxID=1298857 RepID=UPI0003F82556|nr:helix-turn-helix domain-containing protein [Candidatus Solirubrobacter pratensis]
MHDVEVIERPEAAITALDPIRARLLAELATPHSAASLAAKVGLPRQKVNYHLRQLEAHGLVALHEERAHGGLTERVVTATARAFFVDPAAVGGAARDETSPAADRLSARYLIAVAARLVREVGRVARRGPVATLTIDTEIAFATPQARAAFADDLAAAVTALAAKYHDDGGRPHRLVVAAHPLPEEEAPDDTP